MKDTVNVEISKALVEPIVHAKIQAAVIQALSENPEEYINAIVGSAMRQKVDSEGRPDRYSNGVPYIEHMAQKVIKNAAAAALQKWVGEHQEIIEAAILKEMSSKRGAALMAKSLSEGIASSLKCNWQYKCEVKIGGRE